MMKRTMKRLAAYALALVLLLGLVPAGALPAAAAADGETKAAAVSGEVEAERGRYAKNGDVTIIGGNVVAIGNRGAGIGGGYQGDDTNTDVSGGSVYIYGGRVNATGGENAAGIGGGGATEPAVSVLFYANDGSGASVTQDVPVGEATALQENGFTRRGWTFAGWNTVETPTESEPGTAYTDKQSVTLSENLTLYAQWTPNGIAADALTGTYTYSGAAQTPAVTVRDAVTQEVLTLGEDYEVTYSNNTAVTASGASFTVAGKGDYAGAETKGGFKIRPKAVTVKAQSKEFTYNGTAQSWNKYDVTGLVGRDKITAVVVGSITFPDEGAVTNKVESYTFATGSASNYKVTVTDGKLTMANASVKITIIAASQSWTYDGNSHSNPEVKLTSGELFPGDTLVATATGSVKDVSMLTVCNNVVADGYKVEHDGKDVTASYVITAVDGMLSILPKSASVTADDKVKTVGEDDPELTATVKGVIEGETLNYTLTRTGGEEVGEHPITVKLGENPNYKVTAKNGTLTIRPLCADGHKPEKTAESKPTCTEPGNSEYYTCTVCGAYFSDENAQYQIEKDSWVIPATGHKYGKPEWSWRRDYQAAEATFTCAACGDKQTLKATVVALTVEPTCTLPGKITYTAFVYFLEEKYEDSKEVTIQPLGHSYGKPEWNWKYDLSAAEATFTCAKCGDKQTVTATVESKTIDPTCTEEGKLVCVATVVFHEETYQDEKTGVIPATGHTYGEPIWNWKDDYSAAEATFICKCGDDKQTVTATVTSETVKPTCTEDGKVVYKAKVTFRKEAYTDEKEVVLPAPGHSFGEPDWNWADDCSTADATFICAACSDKQTVKATITSETTDPTCNEDGRTVYTAAAVFAEKTYKSEKTKVIAATGHKYGEPEWKWSEDFSAADAIFTCAACGDQQTVGATVVTETTDPTCTEEGKIVRSASAVFAEKTYKTSETQIIAALGHTPGEAKTENEIAPTCTGDGSFDTVVSCTVCGEKLSRETTVVPATGHDWGDWIVTKEPTEEEEGEEIRCCKNDPTHFETRPIPPLSHVHDLHCIEAVPATCTDAGSSEYYECTGCGRFFADAEAAQEIEKDSWIIPPLGHLFGADSFTAEVAPTCTEGGSPAYYTCERCGKFFSDPDGTQELTAEDLVLPALGHDWGDWEVVTPADEYRDGEERRVCRNDASHVETRPIPRLEHENCPSAQFKDTDAEAWYHESLDYVLAAGLMNGVSPDAAFDPDGTVTRAMVVTVLYRIEGEPDAPQSPFKDVEAGSWYEAAVNWAAANGITLGVSKTQFAPNEPVTREQMVTFFCRYAQYKGCDVTANGTLEAFTDAGKVSAWAVDALRWATENELVNGMTENLLDPTATGTRSQLCAVIHRFCINILGMPSYAELAHHTDE